MHEINLWQPEGEADTMFSTMGKRKPMKNETQQPQQPAQLQQERPEDPASILSQGSQKAQESPSDTNIKKPRHMWNPELDVQAALDDYLKGLEFPPQMTTVIDMVMRRWLISKGYTNLSPEAPPKKSGKKGSGD